jgi:hypothetical protein
MSFALFLSMCLSCSHAFLNCRRLFGSDIPHKVQQFGNELSEKVSNGGVTSMAGFRWTRCSGPRPLVVGDYRGNSDSFGRRGQTCRVRPRSDRGPGCIVAEAAIPLFPVLTVQSSHHGRDADRPWVCGVKTANWCSSVKPKTPSMTGRSRLRRSHTRPRRTGSATENGSTCLVVNNDGDKPVCRTHWPLVCTFGRLFAQSGKRTWCQPQHPPGATGQMASMSTAGFQHKLAGQPGDEQLLRPLDAAVHHVLMHWHPKVRQNRFEVGDSKIASIFHLARALLLTRRREMLSRHGARYRVIGTINRTTFHSSS